MSESRVVHTAGRAAPAVAITFAVLAAAGLTVHAVHGATGFGGALATTVVSGWIYCGLFLMTAVSCAVRARRAPEQRLPWTLAAIGVTVWAAAEVTYRVVEPDPSAPYPALTQALLLLSFFMATVTLVLLGRDRVRGVHLGLALDGLIGGLAISAVTAALLFPAAGAPAAAQPGPPALFLMVDLAILTFVVVTIGLTGWRPGTCWGLLCTGIVLNTVGNVALVQATQAGTFERGSIVDTIYAASALSLGLAALYPIRAHERVRFDGSRTLLAPSGFALVGVALLLYGTFRGISVEAAVLGGATLVMLIVRTTMAFRENRGLLEVSRHEALTDGLTSLGNRRSLMLDLQRTSEGLAAGRPATLVLFDLDGFKGYNDSFGHPAGDALLARLAGRFAVAIGDDRAYRAGGDEFCALLRCSHAEATPRIAQAAAALSEIGDGFHVTTSFGSVGLPEETADPAEALQIADSRMYEQKDSRRVSASQQSRAVLMQVLNEREPGLRDHQDEVADLATAVARHLELEADEIRDVAGAAEFHDIGKIAVPDAILYKPAPLDEAELAFIRQHTIIGERILLAAPALS